MFHALWRPATSSSDRGNSALAPAPPLSARAASATAFRYCGTANLALAPRPTTSTRGAATPGRSCSSAVRPVLPDTSPRSTRACRRPPLALSTACAAGDSTLSAKTPTMTPSVVAVAGVDWFRANSRVMGLYGSLESGWRSEESRVGKECVSTCRSRRAPEHHKKKQHYHETSIIKHKI